MREGWLCVAAGLLIPFFALWGVRIGWAGRRTDSGRLLVAAGLLIFTVRVGLYLGVFG